MNKTKKIFAAVIILAVLGYGAYVYKDRFWERTDQKDAYESKFNDKNINQNSTKDEDFRVIGEDLDNHLKSEEDEQTNGNDNNNSNENVACEEKAGSERDECFKDRAIANKDDNTCNEISNSSTKETCINAVAEEVLDEL